MCTLTILELPLPVPAPPSMQVVRQSVLTEPGNAWHPHGRHQCDSQSLVRVQVTRAYCGTAAAGSNATRRQYRDDWPYWQAPLHHMHLGDRAFAQIPPILSGKPPPRVQISDIWLILACPKGVETAQNTHRCCRMTSNCSQWLTSWARRLPCLAPER